MQLKTILNRVTHYKSFVIAWTAFIDKEQPVIEVTMPARSSRKPLCSVCNQPASCYDALPPWRYDFILLSMIPVVLIYARRRVDSQQCGVKAEWIP